MNVWIEWLTEHLRVVLGEVVPGEVVLGGLLIAIIITITIMSIVRKSRGLGAAPTRYCDKGHPMDPNWTTCAFCDAERRAAPKTAIRPVQYDEESGIDMVDTRVGADMERASYPYIGLRRPSKLKSDHVNFAVFSQEKITANSIFLLDVWAYLSGQYAHIESVAKQGGRDRLLGWKEGVPIFKGALLNIQIEIMGFSIEEPYDVIAWDGVPVNASFIIKTPLDIKPGSYKGKVSIGYQGLTIAKVVFVVSIDLNENRDYMNQSYHTAYPKTAFASYSSEDREEVLHRVQGMTAIVPDLDIFMDVFSIRSGQNWREKLEEHVPKKDIFYLFWSQPAARSEWVEREWRLALTRRGLNYIDPVPLEEPDRVPPPQELSALHFGDAYLAYSMYERLKRKAGDDNKR